MKQNSQLFLAQEPIGRQQPEEAGAGIGSSVVLAVGSGVLLCIVYLLFADPIVKMFGGIVNRMC